nr:PrsW family intramembrane metalloprotease [Corynebacterium lactis]
MSSAQNLQELRGNRSGTRSEPGLGNDAVWWVLVVFGAAGLAGLAVEFIPKVDKNPNELGLVIGALILGLVILVFIVALFDRTKVRKEPGQKVLWFYSFILGGLIAPWVSLHGNEAMGDGLTGLLSRETLADWNAALVAPGVEELSKGAVALGMIIVFRYLVTRPIHAFYVGIAVGFGFQFTEDILYAISAAFESLNSDFAGGIQSVILRTVSGLISHWIYTGIFALGLAFMLGITYGTWAKGKRIAVGLALCLAAVAIHFLWNSPLTFDNDYVIFAGLVAKSIFTFAVFVVIARITVTYDRAALGLPSRKEMKAAKKAAKEKAKAEKKAAKEKAAQK